MRSNQNRRFEHGIFDFLKRKREPEVKPAPRQEVSTPKPKTVQPPDAQPSAKPAEEKPDKSGSIVGVILLRKKY